MPCVGAFASTSSVALASVEAFATTSGVEAFAWLHSVASSEITAVVATDECAPAVVIARSRPAVGAMIEVMVVGAVESERRIAHAVRRIEAPTEWAVENCPIRWNERVGAVVRIPIPTIAGRTPRFIILRAIHVGFRQVRRA